MSTLNFIRFKIRKLYEKKKNPCWKSYRKVKGKKDYEDGSCEKIDEKKYPDGSTYKDSSGKTHKRVSSKGTKRGDSYCARSYGQMKDFPKAAKDPNSKLRQRRKAWGCKGKKSIKEFKNEYENLNIDFSALSDLEKLDLDKKALTTLKDILLSIVELGLGKFSIIKLSSSIRSVINSDDYVRTQTTYALERLSDKERQTVDDNIFVILNLGINTKYTVLKLFETVSHILKEEMDDMNDDQY